MSQPMVLRYETRLAVPAAWTLGTGPAVRVGLLALGAVVFTVLPVVQALGMSMAMPHMVLPAVFCWAALLRIALYRYTFTRDGIECRAPGYVRRILWPDVQELAFARKGLVVLAGGRPLLTVPMSAAFFAQHGRVIRRLWRQRLTGSGRRRLRGFTTRMPTTWRCLLAIPLLTAVAMYAVICTDDERWMDLLPLTVAVFVVLPVLVGGLLWRPRAMLTPEGLLWRRVFRWRLLPWSDVCLIQVLPHRWQSWNGLRLGTSYGLLRCGFVTLAGERTARLLRALVVRARRAQGQSGPEAQPWCTPPMPPPPARGGPCSLGRSRFPATLVQVLLMAGSVCLLIWGPDWLPRQGMALLAYLLAWWLPLPGVLTLLGWRRERRFLRHLPPAAPPLI